MTARLKTVRLLYSNNGVGLTRDAELLRDILTKAGYKVESYTGDANGFVPSPAALNIHLEIVYKQFLTRSRNVLIPNPEWFFRDWSRHLRSFRSIWCKTKDAQQIFGGLSLPTEHIGFTSGDRLDASVAKELTFVHFAGQSINKGTRQTLNAFCQPDMPPLTVYSMQPSTVRANKLTPNITVRLKRLSDPEMKREQNRHAVHVCCSTYEGFGHYINEAKSCGAAILTTNAPPMNELVDPDFGFGVSVSTYGKQELARLAFPNESVLAYLVKKIAACPLEALLAVGRKARNSYLENDAYFRRRILEEVRRTIYE